MSDRTTAVTELLRKGGTDEVTAVDRVIPLVYKELRRLASAYLARQPPGHSLQPTALVHEAYLRLAERSVPDWQDRVHFISVAARIMRQVLVDHARSRSALKRHRGQRAVEFRDTLAYTDEKASQLVVLDDALDALEKLAPRQVRVLELRYFGGLSVEETADALGVSSATIGRESRHAEAWLKRELRRHSGSEQAST